MAIEIWPRYWGEKKDCGELERMLWLKNGSESYFQLMSACGAADPALPDLHICFEKNQKFR